MRNILCQTAFICCNYKAVEPQSKFFQMGVFVFVLVHVWAFFLRAQLEICGIMGIHCKEIAQDVESLRAFIMA